MEITTNGRNVNCNEDPALTGALEAARAGLQVVPVCGIDASGKSICFAHLRKDPDKRRCKDNERGKHRLLPDWKAKPTTDLKQIRRWRREHPLSNFGIVTGHSFFVVDIDPRHGGDETLWELKEKYGPLPDTVQVLSGGGGEHYYGSSRKCVPGL